MFMPSLILLLHCLQKLGGREFNLKVNSFGNVLPHRQHPWGEKDEA